MFPIEIKLAIDMPPSTNRLWRAGNKRVHRSKAYSAWKIIAVLQIAEQRRGKEVLNGHFSSEVVFDEEIRRSNMDLDNRLKALFDVLQATSVIENDALQDRLTACWGKAPPGKCSIYLEGERAVPWSPEKHKNELYPACP